MSLATRSYLITLTENQVAVSLDCNLALLYFLKIIHDDVRLLF